MSKHTAAPWNWNDDENTIHRADGIKIAAAYDLRDDADGDVAEANAALIAAAPDLLAALETMLEYDTGTPDDVLKQTRAAISKAKGQQ